MMILSCIAIVFALSWLPMTAFTVLVEFNPRIVTSPSTLYLVFSICHLTAMSTAVTNPLMYGWLNTNFRREFRLLSGQDRDDKRRSNANRERRVSAPQSMVIRHDRRTSMTCFTTMTSSNTRPSTTLTFLPQSTVDNV
ncbi:hypothetical protein O3M35_012084 [Rhynocoris fuscipes]|uniref:G-protein coupled receptors family 1 profile domain-containing protein n=1 Tax=Rhynocoris fuscipes TaxID=488301 RepID=A0AAW1CWX0_9HEMI